MTNVFEIDFFPHHPVKFSICWTWKTLRATSAPSRCLATCKGNA